jgi:hypothetical protein
MGIKDFVKNEKIVQWETSHLAQRRNKELLEKVQKKIKWLNNYDLVDEVEILKGLKHTKKIHQAIIVSLLLVHLFAFLFSWAFGWTVLWNPITSFWQSGGRTWNNMFGYEAESKGPFGLPIALNGTCGLVLALFLGGYLWPGWGIFNERLNLGITNVYDKVGRRLGITFSSGGISTQTRYIDDDTIACICTPKKDNHYNKFVLLFEFLYSYIPLYYDDIEQLWPFKYLIIIKPDALEPKENYSLEDIYLQDDLWDTKMYLYSQGGVIKVFTCGFKSSGDKDEEDEDS